MSPTYQDVEAAIAGVDGVAEATVRTTEGSSRGRLRIRLVPGHDPDVVSYAVADVLRARFGIDIDPSAIRPTATSEDGGAAPTGTTATEPSPATAVPTSEPDEDAAPPDVPDEAVAEEPAEPVTAAASVSEPVVGDDPPPTRAGLPGVDELFRPTAAGARGTTSNGTGHEPATRRSFHRPLIRDLALGSRGLEIAAEVLLDLDGTEIRGRAVGPATRRSTFRAIARATLDAVEAMFPGDVKTELETIELDDDGVEERVTVTVTFLTEAGADRLVGVSLSRGDAEQAVLRATLDAVNRRVGLLLDD